ncbi:hypothetical protein pneo_cds_3 [Pandoravirus neocaledonia]|uniref:Uncharacterized protein n=1 Tax=Pandoravirus neocaledonia TaxID=2107708 RepID=A0A2U7UB92_9VIRU|nr:hypothetical protein pneo_cds_3 [Pandoravirus neocaledonia]AVK75610.1 hypothetical protein pneo_cds_3 [Pandoravirus neocaledonia]
MTKRLSQKKERQKAGKKRDNYRAHRLYTTQQRKKTGDAKREREREIQKKGRRQPTPTPTTATSTLSPSPKMRLRFYKRNKPG